MKAKRILALVLSLAMMITLLPTATLAEGTTSPAQTPEVSGSKIFANGIALILTAGTGGTTETPYTVIYIDADRDGVIDDGEQIFDPTGTNAGTAGNDLSKFDIYGGSHTGTVDSTKITMLGGSVNSIYGGSGTATPGIIGTVSDDTHVTISGGTLNGAVYGGGNGTNSTVGGDTYVNISGGTVISIVCGGDAWKGTVGGNTNITISGSASVGAVYGGGHDGTVGKDANVTITGGTVINFVTGGDYGGTVTGNVTVTISGGTVGSTIYGVSIYGGSTGGTVGGNATVTISGDAKVDGSIYGDHDNGETVTGTASIIYPADKLGGASGTTYTVVDAPVIDNTPTVTSGTVTLAKDQSVTLNGKNYTAAEDNTKLNISNGVVSILAGSVVSDDDGKGTGNVTVSGGEGASGSGNYEVGQKVTINAGTRTGYSFSGWSFDPAFVPAKEDGFDAHSPKTSFTMPAGNVTVTAGWTINQYTITFDSAGGSEIASITLPYGTQITAPSNPTKSGYTFKGWLDEEGNIVEIPETMPGENITLKASWQVQSSGSRNSSSSTTTTTTTKNDDGSTTKTVTNKITGTVTETTTNPDGSTTKVETKKDGTVTTTEKDADGNITTTVENPDGTSTTTEKTTDGTTTVTEKDADGTTTTTETDKAGNKTVTTENTDGSTVTEETKKDGTKVVTKTNSDGETTATVETKEETEVIISVANADKVTKVVVTDENGVETEAEFTVTDGGVAITVDGNVAVSVQTESGGSVADFTDVDKAAWYHESLDYVLANGLMNGTAADKFEPEANLTRAMLVTILYRAEGEPATNRSIPFADVDMGSWYANAVIWAQQNSIVTGITETEFAPNDNITREQIATILYRYAILKGMDAVTLAENLGFTDADEISEYAVSAMNWAVDTGLIKGYEDNTVRPQNNATRAEAAALLQRFLVNNK